MIQKNSNGFIGWHALLAVTVVGVISFAGGSVYTAQQKTKNSNRSSTTQDSKKATTISTAEKKSAETEQKSVEVPAEKSKVEPAVTATSEAIKKSSDSQSIKKAPVSQQEKKEPTRVAISAISQVGAESVLLKALLPTAYSGTCKALVKHTDGTNHRWIESSFSSSSSCTITVPRASLVSAKDWQYYLYFNSSDWTVKGESGKHTFSL